MPRRTKYVNWNFKGLREKYADLKEVKPILHFKEVIGIKKKNYSFDEKRERMERLISFNRFFQTEFIIEWQQVGQADIFNIKEITTKSGQLPLFG